MHGNIFFFPTHESWDEIKKIYTPTKRNVILGKFCVTVSGKLKIKVKDATIVLLSLLPWDPSFQWE